MCRTSEAGAPSRRAGGPSEARPLLDIWTLYRHFAVISMTHLEDSPGLLGEHSDSIGYTCKLKVYPSGSVAATACDRPIFRPEGWEERHPRSSGYSGLTEVDMNDTHMKPDRAMWEAQSRKARANLERSKRRALTAVRDYALSNRFRYFVTLTLDKERIDRYDYAAIIRAMRVWCDNQVRRKGLYYILVPELHKDGALHFHGFFPEGVEVVPSGTIIPPGGDRPRKPRSKRQAQAWLASGGHQVYNLPGWGFGWSTAIELYGTYSAAVAYVCKYISKAEGKIGGRWYFHGGSLRKPDIQYTDSTIDDILRDSTDTGTGECSARVYEVPAINLRLCYSFTEVTWDDNRRTVGQGGTGGSQGGSERVGPSGPADPHYAQAKGVAFEADTSGGGEQLSFDDLVAGCV